MADMLASASKGGGACATWSDELISHETSSAILLGRSQQQVHGVAKQVPKMI